MAAEVQLQTAYGERINIAHSIVPEVVCTSAREAMSRTCRLGDGECWWR
eukprot:CAMPEP_0115309934 /NCGR_PEP_ID=MMETSP0270-20121206/74519_1 /TAXON_ID=71861 /ORGANISM="Scrippsiella trochoidea, Strain CCMP3099" /LENGTH=48 /DNA_ID= /DNA_START= /DNA_END= /DNA_ORIENTATION=